MAPIDTTQNNNEIKEVNTDDYSFDDVPEVKKDTVVVPAVVEAKKDEKSLNTDDYKFEDDAVKTSKPSDTFLSRYMKARENGRVTGPFPYLPKFSYENLATNFVIDPLRGFGIRIETQMNDILENFRITGGIQTAFDWKSGDVYGEFQYLKHRVDFGIRYDRKVIFWTENYSDLPAERTKYSWQKIELQASLP
ncbi:MAG: hypothetical protein WDN75_03625 [Bacteroidota bacterium]